MKKSLIVLGTAVLFLTIFIFALFHAPKGTDFLKWEAQQKRIQEIQAQKKKEFNKIVFVWEGLESDIPNDGDYIQITGTDENTVYINAIDE